MRLTTSDGSKWQRPGSPDRQLYDHSDVGLAELESICEAQKQVPR
jgi:hypothetical protein